MRKKIMFFIILLIVVSIITFCRLILLNNINDKSIYYVSENGNDNNTGTINSPLKSVQKACDKMKAGDVLLIRSGIYKERIIFNVSGSKKQGYITIKNYPNEKAIIDGSNGEGEAILNINGQSYIRIEGIEITNITQRKAYGIYMGNAENNIQIINNDINNIKCLYPESTNGQGNGANAILLFGKQESKSIKNVLIKGNKVHELVCGWNEAITIAGNCEYVDVVENSITNTGNIGIDFAGNYKYCNNPKLDQPRHCTAVNNIISECKSPNATSYGIYIDGARDIILDNNVIFNSQGGIQVAAEMNSEKYPTKDIVIKNNIAYNNETFGITIGAFDKKNYKGVLNVKVINNIIMNNGKKYGSELKINAIRGLEIENNLLYKSENSNFIETFFSKEYISDLRLENNKYFSKLSKDNMNFILYNKQIKGFSDWVNTSVEKNPIYIEDFKDNKLNYYKDKIRFYFEIML